MLCQFRFFQSLLYEILDKTWEMMEFFERKFY